MMLVRSVAFAAPSIVVVIAVFASANCSELLWVSIVPLVQLMQVSTVRLL